MLATATTYQTTTGETISDETVWTLTSGLKYLGSGVTRKVYAISDTEVLKICTDKHSYAGNNLSEAATWENIAESDRRYFARVLAVSPNGDWLVAERAYGTAMSLGSDYGDDSERWEMENVAENYGIGDLHDGNWGWREDGTPLVIDYAMSPERGAGCDPAWCEGCTGCRPCGFCDRCSCEACKPEGCECGTFQGCNETACSLCSLKPGFAWDVMAVTRLPGTLFGFVRIGQRNVCRNHAPKKPSSLAAPQIWGQGAMIGERWTNEGIGRLVMDVLKPHARY